MSLTKILMLLLAARHGICSLLHQRILGFDKVLVTITPKVYMCCCSKVYDLNVAAALSRTRTCERQQSPEVPFDATTLPTISLSLSFYIYEALYI